jgi:hemin uptake protein HemP
MNRRSKSRADQPTPNDQKRSLGMHPESPRATRDSGAFAARRQPATAMVRPVTEPRWPERPELPRHDARQLTQGGVEAEIRLDGIRYVLRITRQGKLILTK